MDLINLSNLRLIQFKNYSQSSFLFTHKIVCITGANGVGKTNLVDAIYHLGLGRSYFYNVDALSIAHDQSFATILGAFQFEDRSVELQLSMEKGKKKVLKFNGKPYDKLMEHVGKIPIVMIAPDDIALVNEGSEIRRKFLDTTLCQVDQAYLSALAKYQKIVKQRNALLKQFSKSKTYNEPLLKSLTEQLIPEGVLIHQKRTFYWKLVAPLMLKWHEHIAQSNESLTIAYKSELEHDQFEFLLHKALQKDRILARTSVGIHKDDIDIKIGGYAAKKVASQGQKKSILIAMKMAQLEFLSQQSQKKPILILDDIYDKLDVVRSQQILELARSPQIGQVFITDTQVNRVQSGFEKLGESIQLLNLSSEQV